ncbi:MAG: Uma2 family endonuclease [Deltaproteobacteria bacterium]|nr:Uma2 family endonuclease [Deltaproteobacteria bacterium]
MVAVRATSHRRMLTYEDYAAIPADGQVWELLEGQFNVNPAPTLFHQTVSRRLQHLLMLSHEDPGLACVFDAPTDLILDQHNVVQPDLVVIGKDRARIMTDRAVEGVPDLVVEVLSPSNTLAEQDKKKRIYERFGIPEYWVVHPLSARIDVDKLKGRRYRRAATYGPADTFTYAGLGARTRIVLAKLFRPHF